MITIKNLNYKYKTSDFGLKDINLKIDTGEFVCIIGKNGSGKSTFSKILAGITKFKNGEIFLDNISLKDKRQSLEIRKNIGIVFQNPENQILFDKVYDDLKFGLHNLGFSNDAADANIDEALQLVNMSEYKNASTSELSLGQKQRIALASVLAIKPKVLILDEPTTMLDPISKNQMYSVLQNLKKSGITIIYITNIIDETLLCDRIIFFEEGKIKKDFLKRDLLENLDFLDSLEFPGIVSLIASLHKFGIDISLENLKTDELAQKIIDFRKD